MFRVVVTVVPVFLFLYPFSPLSRSIKSNLCGFSCTDSGGLQKPERHNGLLLSFLQQQPSAPIRKVLGHLLLPVHEWRRWANKPSIILINVRNAGHTGPNLVHKNTSFCFTLWFGFIILSFAALVASQTAHSADSAGSRWKCWIGPSGAKSCCCPT